MKKYVRIETLEFSQPGKRLRLPVDGAHKLQVKNLGDPVYLGEYRIDTGAELVLESPFALPFFDDLHISSGGVTLFHVVIYKVEER